MRYKILLFLLIFTGIAFQSLAQAEISFEETTFEFGEVTEGDKATHTFEFTNTGDQPLILQSVRASCGCTTPLWTREPIEPGKKGIVKATYNSRNRPGQFRKSITISSNAKKGTHVVYIKGNVVKESALTQKVITPEQLKQSPKFTLKEPTLQAGLIQSGQKVPLKLEVSNTGKNPLKIEHISSACNCVRLNKFPAPVLAAGETQIIELVFAPQHEGKVNETVFVHTNDLTNPKAKFRVEAEVKKDLANQNMLKEQKNKFGF